ncbi:hypothetical protein PTSG_02214 [Salpingoeca rosetta]|uniref:Phorbol-ester/DAG-type domain-containing protein n=1 Tax=Salpingoeca rosetta (strain ATCC 50818 / BSB-021) TaxID=946362 RepID=F2U1J4_SALR5|nr:uncharacterized protein PTSG_02214 [Salpingoeca rosetta]EGD81496.1 hypothetical protein PTSG_02214 [Salpingoeca rosetta]|eukprot:XP_004996700.1 hypothetical protein PTSG_02214 [Salpingoeca rosetta]
MVRMGRVRRSRAAAVSMMLMVAAAMMVVMMAAVAPQLVCGASAVDDDPLANDVTQLQGRIPPSSPVVSATTASPETQDTEEQLHEEVHPRADDAQEDPEAQQERNIQEEGDELKETKEMQHQQGTPDSSSKISASNDGDGAEQEATQSEQEAITPTVTEKMPETTSDDKQQPEEQQRAALGWWMWWMDMLDTYSMSFMRVFLEQWVIGRVQECLTGTEGACGVKLPLPLVVGGFLVAATAAVLAAGLMTEQNASNKESVNWLNMWWTEHAPRFGRERLQRVLVRALNDEFQPAQQPLGTSVRPLKVLSVSLESCPLPTLSKMRCFGVDTSTGSRQLFLACDIHIRGSKGSGAMTMEVAVPPSHRITTTVVSLRAKAFFTMTPGDDAVASLSLRNVRDVKLASTSHTGQISTSLIHPRIIKALKSFITAPKSLQWHLSDPPPTETANILRHVPGIRSSQAPSRVASHTTTTSDALSKFRDGEDVNIKLSFISAQDLITARADTSVSCTVTVDSPSQRFRTRIVGVHDSSCHFSDETVITLHMESSVVFEVFEESPATVCIGTANMSAKHLLTDPNKLFPISLRGRLTNMEIPKGVLTIRWRPAKPGDPAPAPSSPMLSRSNRMWPSSADATPRRLSVKTDAPPVHSQYSTNAHAHTHTHMPPPHITSGTDLVLRQLQHAGTSASRLSNHGQHQQHQQRQQQQQLPTMQEHAAVVVDGNDMNGVASPPISPQHRLLPTQPPTRLSQDALARLDAEQAGNTSALTAPSVISGMSGLTDVSHGTGWAIPGRRPVVLVETTHSYGTHLSVENASEVPPHIARWKGKTRRLYVMNGHAFTASKVTSSSERCAVSNNKLARALSRKCYRCKYCGIAVEKTRIPDVEETCARSQLPDMTLGSFSHERMQHSVTGSVVELAQPSSRPQSTPATPR